MSNILTANPQDNVINMGGDYVMTSTNHSISSTAPNQSVVFARHFAACKTEENENGNRNLTPSPSHQLPENNSQPGVNIGYIRHDLENEYQTAPSTTPFSTYRTTNSAQNAHNATFSFTNNNSAGQVPPTYVIERGKTFSRI